MKRSTQIYTWRAADIIRRIQYITVASVTPDARPWNSPVQAVFDDELNWYWFSDKEGRHSRNVKDNGEVFLVIYDSTVPEGQGVGVYFEASAVELTDTAEVIKARRLKHEDVRADPGHFLGPAVRRVYKGMPRRVWTNDIERRGSSFIRDFRVELKLADLRAAVSSLNL